MGQDKTPTKQPSPKKPTPPPAPPTPSPFKKTGKKTTDAEKRKKGDWSGPKYQE